MLLLHNVCLTYSFIFLFLTLYFIILFQVDDDDDNNSALLQKFMYFVCVDSAALKFSFYLLKFYICVCVCDAYVCLLLFEALTCFTSSSMSQHRFILAFVCVRRNTSVNKRKSVLRMSFQVNGSRIIIGFC